MIKMKKFLYNAGYFFKEVKTVFRLNLLSNIITIFSTGLIFFILSMIIAGWWVSSSVVDVIQKDAEISVYYNESLDNAGVLKLVDSIKRIEGVRDVQMVDKDQAYSRMSDILGKDAQVLKFFDDNPFSPFLEVNINLKEIDQVLKSINLVSDIEYVRDNRDILDRIRDISDMLGIIGFLVIAAVGISTLVIISHIIRLGIHNSRDQINTLKLLGAPRIFISFPFLLEGLLLTLLGGVLAVVLSVLLINFIYSGLSGPLPFIPLPPQEEIVPGLIGLILSLSAFLGIAGSMFGLSSVGKE